jgi:hypothetical protein
MIPGPNRRGTEVGAIAGGGHAERTGRPPERRFRPDIYGLILAWGWWREPSCGWARTDG